MIKYYNYYILGTPVITLNATATTKVKSTIINSLEMKNCQFVTEDVNRPNIKYSILKTKNDVTSLFDWQIQEIKKSGIHAPKVLIFCQRKRDCTDLYEYFDSQLGTTHMYHTPNGQAKNDKTCFIGMYHHATREAQKKTAEEAFTSDESIMKVLFCTSSFGLGVNVQNCHLVIHVGPTKTVDQFLQESGRAGRNNAPSHSIMIMYPNCTSGSAFEDEMKVIFRNREKCRREMLMSAIENPYPLPKLIPHMCCDICAQSCNCLCVCSNDKCLCEPRCVGENIYQTQAEQELIQICSKENLKINQLPMVYTITEHDRELLHIHLLQIQAKITEEGVGQDSVMQPHLCTGFSDQLIKSIVMNVEYVSSVETLLRHFPFFNDCHATIVYDCIARLFSSKIIDHDDLQDSDCLVDLPLSESSSEEDINEEDLDECAKPYLHDSDSE